MTAARAARTVPENPERYFANPFAHVPAGARIGADCNICDRTFIEGGAETGEEILLDRPERALYVPPMVWTTQYRYSPDAVVLALASDVYREEDYIRDFEAYRVSIAPDAAGSAFA